jgi:hypothetical protein
MYIKLQPVYICLSVTGLYVQQIFLSNNNRNIFLCSSVPWTKNVRTNAHSDEVGCFNLRGLKEINYQSSLFKRHANLSLRKPERRSCARAQGLTKGDFTHYFNNFKNVLK